MKYAKHMLVVSLLVLAGMTSFQLRVNNGQAAGKPNSPSTDKSWSLYSMPYISADIGRRPVIVRSVTTDAKRGLAVNQVEIFSRSKAVKSVKLKWYLSDDKNKGVILLQGETPVIKFDRVLPAGGTTQIRQEVVVFEKILDKVKAHAARGAEFHFDVSVSSAAYADGGTWEEQAVARLDYLGIPTQARSDESLSDYLNFPKETWANDSPFVKIGYVKTTAAPAPQGCIPTYTACVYHSCGGHGCYWADCSNNIPAPSMCQSDPYGSWCTTTYCG